MNLPQMYLIKYIFDNTDKLPESEHIFIYDMYHTDTNYILSQDEMNKLNGYLTELQKTQRPIYTETNRVVDRCAIGFSIVTGSILICMAIYKIFFKPM